MAMIFDSTEQPWEVLLDALAAGRMLTADELDLLDEAAVKVAVRRGLARHEAGQKRLSAIHDERRERAWYDN
jgi:hypothetical protein